MIVHKSTNIYKYGSVFMWCVSSWIKQRYHKYLVRTTRMPAFWDTPRRPMITQTRDSHQIPSQSKTKSNLQILKNCQNNSNFGNLQETLHKTCLLKLLDKIINMKWIQPELLALQSRHGMRDGRTDRQIDGRTDGQSETNIPPPPLQQLRCIGGMIIEWWKAETALWKSKMWKMYLHNRVNNL